MATEEHPKPEEIVAPYPTCPVTVLQLVRRRVLTLGQTSLEAKIGGHVLLAVGPIKVFQGLPQVVTCAFDFEDAEPGIADLK